MNQVPVARIITIPRTATASAGEKGEREGRVSAGFERKRHKQWSTNSCEREKESVKRLEKGKRTVRRRRKEEGKGRGAEGRGAEERRGNALHGRSRDRQVRREDEEDGGDEGEDKGDDAEKSKS
jgi:hypothetical protein